MRAEGLSMAKNQNMNAEEAEHMLSNAIEIGSRMIVAGAEIQRAESSIRYICTAYGAERTEIFCINYVIMATIYSESYGSITVSRSVPSVTQNLYELIYLNSLSRRICNTRPDMKKVDAQLTKIDALPRYSEAQNMAIYAMVAGFFCLFFGGSWVDAIAAAVVGFAMRCFEIILRPFPLNRFLLILLQSLGAGCLAGALGLLPLGISVDKVSIGAIMVVIPGVMFVNSIREIISENMLSGITRLMEAILITSSIAIGFSLANYLL